MQEEASRDLNELASRAAKASGLNAAIHEVSATAEIDTVTTTGTPCASCRHVAEMPWGRQACRKSREPALLASLRRRRPVPFLCHMGFSCVAMALPKQSDSPSLVLTLGPFRPSDVPEPPEREAHEGLERLSRESVDVLPFTLLDLPIVPANTVPEVAYWTAEWAALRPNQPDKTSPLLSETAPAFRKRRPARKNKPRIPSTHDLVAAIQVGDTNTVRNLVQGQLKESAVYGTRHSMRLRALRIVAETLESLEISSEPLPPETLRRAARFLDDAADLTTMESVSRLLMRVFAPAKKRTRRNIRNHGQTESWLTDLQRLLDERFPDRITLEQAAASLRIEPSTLSKRLQRKFNLSYSDFAARMRIQHAQRLLRESKLTISDIAARVGLNDASNFSKLFVKHTGLTPTQYLRRFRKG
jgi:AraC-like DNA-binding protein